MQDRLQSLDGEFDLPSQAIKRGDKIDRELLALERCQENDIVGAGQRSGIGQTVILAARPPRLGAGLRGCRRRFLDDDEAHIEWLESAVCLVDADGHVERTLLTCAFEELEPVDRLAVCSHLQAVPRQAYQHVGAGCQSVPNPVRLRKPAITQAYLAWRHGEPVEPLALFGRRNGSVDYACKAGIEAQVQPPDPIAGPLEPTAVDDPDRPFHRLDADLLGNASQPLLAQALQPIGRALEPVENRHIRYLGDARRRCQRLFPTQSRNDVRPFLRIKLCVFHCQLESDSLPSVNPPIPEQSHSGGLDSNRAQARPSGFQNCGTNPVSIPILRGLAYLSAYGVKPAHDRDYLPMRSGPCASVFR